jgi:hypothetical protein
MKKSQTPIIIDIEASGFGSHSYPIEIGLIDDKSNRYCSLITREDDWTHWSESAEAIHGISRDDLLTHGNDPRSIATELNHRLKGKTVYSDAWSHDYPWLRRLFYAALKEPEFRFSSIEIILTEAQISIWDNTKQQVITETTAARHRASTDAYIIQQTWIRSRQGL